MSSQTRTFRAPAVNRLLLYIVVAVPVCTVFFAVTGLLYPAFEERRAQSQEMATIKEDIKGYDAQTANLLLEQERLMDDAYIAQKLKERFGLVRQGEEAYMLVDKQEGDTVMIESALPDEDEQPHWKRILNFLTGWLG